MARPNDHGWDFVKQGGTYQYKEEIAPGWAFIAMVTILEDNSTDNMYAFKLQVNEATEEAPQNGVFDVAHVKDSGGVYSGMPQFYETPEYMCDYTWKKPDA